MHKPCDTLSRFECLTGSLPAAIAARGCGAAVECGKSNSKPEGAKPARKKVLRCGVWIDKYVVLKGAQPELELR